VIHFLKQCETNWSNKIQEDKSFPQPSNKRSSTSVRKSTAVGKKPKTVNNPLIKTDDINYDNFEDDEEEPDEPEEIGTNVQDKMDEKKKNKDLSTKLKIMDNKKHPLAYYKGSLNRIMRTARNINTLQGIPEHTKKYTSEILGFGTDIDAKTDGNKVVVPLQKREVKRSSVIKDVELEDIMVENVSSELDKYSDAGDDDLDSLTRKYSKFGDDEDDEDGEDEDIGDVDIIEEQDIAGDYDNNEEEDEELECIEEIENEVEEDEEEDDEDDDDDSESAEIYSE
jgi:hypothetical protein